MLASSLHNVILIIVQKLKSNIEFNSFRLNGIENIGTGLSVSALRSNPDYLSVLRLKQWMIYWKTRHYKTKMAKAEAILASISEELGQDF